MAVAHALSIAASAQDWHGLQASWVQWNERRPRWALEMILPSLAWSIFKALGVHPITLPLTYQNRGPSACFLHQLTNMTHDKQRNTSREQRFRRLEASASDIQTSGDYQVDQVSSFETFLQSNVRFQHDLTEHSAKQQQQLHKWFKRTKAKTTVCFIHLFYQRV